MGFIFRSKLFASFIVVLVGLMTAAGVFVYETTRDLPDIGDVNSVIKNQTTYIYASDGTLITRLFRENRTIVPLKDISPVLQKAIISVEDQRFYEHRGVDYIRIIGALIKDIRNREASQGASTITQQYVKHAYFSPEKTIARKLREAFLATKLERNYSKEQILEKYLNTIYFGNGAYGIEAAAQSYFGIPASKLNVEQSALLAAMVKSPTRYNPYKDPLTSIKRRNLVIGLMKDQGYIDDAATKAAAARPLAIIPKQSNYLGIAPYYAEWLIRTELKKIGFDEKAVYSQGLRIYTTLDTKMQEGAELAWKRYLPSPRDPDIALVAVEPKTGAVKAMVGGKDFNTQKINLATQGPGRQPGSSFKPFVLTAALMDGVSPDDGFNASSPQSFKLDGGRSWTVHNSSGESGSGVVDLRRGTAWSINVVYAGLITKIGVNKVISAAKKLGVTSYLNPDPAIALGGLERGVHPIEMASAYATFANNGVRNRPYGVERIEMSNKEVIYKHEAEPKQVIDGAVAYLVTDTLKGVVQGGTGTRARIGRPAAGKTGTTQKYVDAWFCGYTPDLATAVWVGYKEDNSRSMKNVHGIRVMGGTFPAQIWASFMKRALKDIKPHNFSPAPDGSLTKILMCDDTNMLATEWCPKTSYHVFVKKYKPKNLKRDTKHKPIPVPDLMGLSQAEAEAKLTELKLGFTVTSKPSDKPKGQVFEQVPVAGTNVKEGAEVQLSVSDGGGAPPPQNEPSEVPNVVGMMYSEALSELESRGFTVATEYRLSDQPTNQVIAQRPPAGFIAEPGANITLVVSGESGSVSLPDVRKRSESRAKEILQGRGFEVVVYGDTNADNVRKYGAGMVSDQSPKPKIRVDRGSKVIIYVTAQN